MGTIIGTLKSKMGRNIEGKKQIWLRPTQNIVLFWSKFSYHVHTCDVRVSLSPFSATSLSPANIRARTCITSQHRNGFILLPGNGH